MQNQKSILSPVSFIDFSVLNKIVRSVIQFNYFGLGSSPCILHIVENQ
jgi:hypothetical protein